MIFKLLGSVTHIGGDTVEDKISVLKLTLHREFFALTVYEEGFSALLTAKVLGDKASLGNHQRNATVGDKRATNISCLRQSKLGRKDHMIDAYFPVFFGCIAVCNIQSAF